MTEPRVPQTLAELLATLEKSGNLRSLARECGLTVRELRNRLAAWRREVSAAAAGAAPGAQTGGSAARAAGDGTVTGATAATPARAAADVGLREALAALPQAARLRESPLPETGSRILEAWTDGASRGNPGPAAIGILFRQHGGPDLCAHREGIGRATNNVAEYRAVLRALELATGWGVSRLDVVVDSELIARQLMGIYRVKSLDLRPLHQRVLFLARGLAGFRVHHVPRERNAAADKLANLALDAAAGPAGPVEA
jgi:ribonuclease HI